MKPARTALIIDDEKQIRRLLRLALEGADFQVYEAETGQAGLSEIVHRRPDVVLLDLGLPDMEGVKVLRRLREWSDVPVLILSVRDDAEEKVAALDSGADDYVTKPFDTAELLARVRAAQRRSLTEAGEPVFTSGSLLRGFLGATGKTRRRRNQTYTHGVFSPPGPCPKCREGGDSSATAANRMGRKSRDPGAIPSRLRDPSPEKTTDQRQRPEPDQD